MIHTEHLRKADESYEVRHDNNGNAVHAYIKDGKVIVFRTLDDFVRYVYLGEPDVERFYADEEDLEDLYACDDYTFDKLKKYNDEHN